MSNEPSKEGNAPPVAPPGELDDDLDESDFIPDDFPGDGPPLIQIVLWLWFGAMALEGVFLYNRANFERKECERVVAQCNADPQPGADAECVEWSAKSVPGCNTALLLIGSRAAPGAN